jgi:hypothetical protein
MSRYDENRSVTTRRHGRTFGWLAAGVAVILLAVGALYSTGRWGADHTRTGSGASTAQLPPGAGPSQPGVPNAAPRR